MHHTIKKYPDGSAYAEMNGSVGAETIFRLNNPEDLWHLNHYVDAYWSTFKCRPIIIIPNLPDAQADRRFEENQSYGLKLVGKFLNGMEADFKIFHPHNQEAITALMDNVKIIDNSYFISNVFNSLYNWSVIRKGYPIRFGEINGISSLITDELILMSSDAGGFKPLMKLCDKIKWQGETFSASKSRSWDEKDGTTFVHRIDRADFNGKDILIIDDICIYGGTFKGISKMLRERNCGKLYLAVSHMTVQNLGADPVTNYFDKVFTTNSKFDEYFHTDKTKDYTSFENLKIIELFKFK